MTRTEQVRKIALEYVLTYGFGHKDSGLPDADPLDALYDYAVIAIGTNDEYPADTIGTIEDHAFELAHDACEKVIDWRYKFDRGERDLTKLFE